MSPTWNDPDPVAISDLTTPARSQAKTPGRKRKQMSYNEDTDNTKDASASPSTPQKKTRSSARSKTITTPKTRLKAASTPSFTSPEKRLRRFRPHPPQSYLVIKDRALTQRLTVLSRTRTDTPECPEEKVSIAGSTGNIYTVHITQVPSCDCPHAKKGNQCKHIIYIMHRVLKAPDNLSYQLALTPLELTSLINSAPPIPTSTIHSSPSSPSSPSNNNNSNRKPITDDCPICYTEFSESPTEATTFCATSCGNNVHKSCMRSWATACKGNPTCPYCRSPWMEGISGLEDLDLKGAARSAEGYVNVAGQLGISGERDSSSYHSFWVRRQQRGRRW